jgi:hypothetical protein
MMHFALQFINIVVNLLDALKTSFSHRSMAARSLGKKDSVSEAAVAGLSLLKVRTKIYFDTDIHVRPVFHTKAVPQISAHSKDMLKLTRYRDAVLYNQTRCDFKGN